MKKNIFSTILSLLSTVVFSQSSVCTGAIPFCGNSGTNSLIYSNTTNVPSQGSIACLGTTPNATWIYFKIAQTGPLAFNLIQNTAFNASGDAIGSRLDVDFAVWGPYDAPSGNCGNRDNIVCPSCPDNVDDPGYYPAGNLIDCSYDEGEEETVTINDAINGKYYLAIVTNFENLPGFIKLEIDQLVTSNPAPTDCDIVCGVTLGADITECNGTPVSITANFVSPPTFGTPTYVWRLNGAIQPLYTTQSISVTQAGTWSVTTTRPGGCFEVSDAMDVIYLPDIPVISPVNLSDCGTLPYVFPTINQNLVISSGYSLTDYSEIYYTDILTAENGDLSGPNVIAPASLINYTITISPVTIWVRIEDRNTGCYVITPIVLAVSASPTGSIAYSGSPFCTGTTTSQPMTGTVTSNGQYTYTTIPLGGPGILSLDLNTGAINPSLSTPGNFTVNYDINTPSCGFFHRDVAVTINASPVISPVVVGTLSICSNATTQLAATTLPSLTTPWLSSNPAIATVSNTGLVTGVAAGTTIITYTNINGCQDTENVTINALPVISNAVISVCVNSSITLSSTNTPAVATPWISSNPAIATISNTGVVTGLATGTTIITYTDVNGCQDTETVTVNTLPVISGTPVACVASTTTLSATNTPALTNPWISSAVGIATISNAGVVTGVSAGTTTITYTDVNGCQDTQTVTINASPVISGTASVCITNTTTLSATNTPAVGTAWSSSNPAIATISNTGVVTGLATGTTIITYTDVNGCQDTETVTVNTLPVISGTPVVCVASTTTLSASNTPALTNPWISSAVGIATISNTGVVTGVSVGTSTITYTDVNGCQDTQLVTVNVLPLISGVASACVNNTTQLAATTLPSLTTPWMSSNPAIATVSNTGLVTGVAAGTTIITYTNINGCQDTENVTINALPVISNAVISVCVNSSITLSSTNTPAVATPWISSNPAIATISNTGVVTGLATGTTIITYTDVNGCQDTETVTVNTLPVISGTPVACVASTTTLSATNTPALTNPWISSAVGIATISNAGVVTGVSAGTTTITYTDVNGCQDTQTVTINASPVISGTASVCITNTTTLSATNTPAVGTAWTSSNPAIATISNTGVVTGLATGTTIITYTDVNGCQDTETVTVNTLPVISGTPVVCVASTTTLSASNTPALTNPWISSAVGIATISNTGVVTGVSVGTSTITYTDVNGCQDTQLVTVNVLPLISGVASACVNNTTQLAATTLPSLTTPWMSSNPAIATVSNTGLVTGVAAGTTIITYTNINGCQDTENVTINALPVISNAVISVCVNSSITLSATNTPAVATPWISSNPAIATISNTGVVTGLTTGTTIITYTDVNGCQNTKLVTVTPLPTVLITLNSASSVCYDATTSPVVTVTGTPNATVIYTVNNTQFSLTIPIIGTINIPTVPLTATTTYQLVSVKDACLVATSQSVTVTVNPKPVPTPDDGYICYDQSNNPVGTYTIDSKLDNTLYDFEWSDVNGIIAGETQSTYTAIADGNYTVKATLKVAPFCASDVVPVNVRRVYQLEQITAEVTSTYFADSQTVTVTVVPAGEYEYQIENGPYQSSNVFVGVTPGTKIVRARNICNGRETEVFIVDYPRYFTPNGDGIHDTWNISSLSAQTNAKIYIFDRLGKLVKQIQPSGAGWDGSFAGNALPSTDYWFTIQYEEDNVTKEFKSHFALKR